MLGVENREFSLKLKIKHFGFYFTYKFIFSELTLGELVQMQYETKELGFEPWLLAFLQEKQIRKWYQPRLTQRSSQNITFEYKKEIFNYILSKSDEKKNVGNGNSDQVGSAPLCSTVVLLMRECGKLSLDDIMNMNKSKISFLSEGLEYVLNEQTKEGRRKNEHKNLVRESRQKSSATKAEIDRIKNSSSEDYIKNLNKK